MNKFSTIFLFLVFMTSCFFALPSSVFSQEVEVWTNLGLYGGEIKDIAIDPSNPDKMFAGSYMGDGLYVTKDGGSSWQAVETENIPEGEGTFKNHVVWAVEIAPSDSNVIWVAHDVWVEKSMDGGKTWTHIYNRDMQKDCLNCSAKEDFRFCMSLAIDPHNPQIVYVGTGGPANTYTDGAVYKTEDGGQTWSKQQAVEIIQNYEVAVRDNFGYAVVDLVIDPNTPNILWLVEDSHGYGRPGREWSGNLFRSTDGGDNWQVIGGFNGSFYTVAIDPHDSNSIFTGNDWGIFRFNRDVGNDVWQSWKYEWILNHSSYPDWPPPAGEVWARRVKAFAFDPQIPHMIYAAWNNPWEEDPRPKVAQGVPPYGYDDWEFYPSNYDFLTLAVHPTDNEVIVGGADGDGALKSEDHGQTWSPINDGINAVIVYDVAINPSDSTHLVAGTISGAYEKQGDTPWSRLMPHPTQSVRFHPTDSATFFAGLNGYLAITINGGRDWAYNDVGVFSWVRDIAIDPVDTDTLFIAVGKEIRKSIDGGVTFDKVLDGENLSGEPYDFNVVVIDPSDHQHILAGGGNFYAPKVMGDLWESTDGGVNWTRTSLQNVIVNALLIDSGDSAIQYAGCGYSGGTDAPIFKSIDGGRSWTPSFDGMPGSSPWNSVTDLEFHRQDPDVIYASTWKQGVFISPNQGEDWLELGKPEYAVFNLATSSLYTATEGGLWQCTGTGLIVGHIKDELTDDYIDKGEIFTDFGVKSICVDGWYMMISPSGIFDVTAIADGYANQTQKDVTVYGSDVSRVNISMKSGLPEPSLGPTHNSSSNGGGYCFIATATFGSSLADQVAVLRKFRDTWLLPYAVGQKIVALYYRAGKPLAMHINSHSWLKLPVKILLYPLVGFAWLMVSTSVLAKGFIFLWILVCVMVVFRRHTTKENISREMKREA